jgi:hypothetical protein
VSQLQVRSLIIGHLLEIETRLQVDSTGMANEFDAFFIGGQSGLTALGLPSGGKDDDRDTASRTQIPGENGSDKDLW